MKKSMFLVALLLVATCCFGLQRTEAVSARIDVCKVVESVAMRIDSDKEVCAVAMRVDLERAGPIAKKGAWLSQRPQDLPSLEAEQWITYYNGTPKYYWLLRPAGTQGATKFVMTDFSNVTYPFWIKKLKHVFYEGTNWPWTTDKFKFRIYNATGDSVIYTSPDVTALKYPTETVFDLGADSVKITAGDFWVSYQPGDTTPTALTDSGAIRNRTFSGGPGSWNPVIPEGQTEARYEFAIQAYVSWGAGTEEAKRDVEIEVEYSHNPIKGYGSIIYTVPAKTNVSIKLFDITGRVVATLADGIKLPGKYEATLGPELVAGVYFCKFRAGDFNKTKKVVLL